MAQKLTKDVQTLLGNPKKAVISMTIPLAITNVVQSANNMIDGIWVAGLGTAALAATGVVFPFFFIMIGVANGIGVGASQAIARRIGAQEYEGTHKVASQAFYMSLIVALALGLVYTLFADDLLMLAGADKYIDECVEYAFPIFVCAPLIMMCSLFTGLLRSEGAAKRAMNMNVVSALINIVLDPIFIYVLDWGLAGAAWATVVATLAALLIALYWYFVSKDTFVRVPLRRFKFDVGLDRDILKVGIPAGMEMMLMSLTAMVMNQIVLGVDPVSGIAVYTAGWRALDMLMIPAMSLGFAIVPIIAAGYGAKEYGKLKETFSYSLRFGVGIMLGVMVFTFACAPLITHLFTYSESSSQLAPEMISFLRIGSSFMPFMAMGFAASGLFQGLGMGMKSFICTGIMNVMRLPICGAIATLGVLSYVWYGLAFSEIFGAVVAGVWGILMVRVLVKESGKVMHDRPGEAGGTR